MASRRLIASCERRRAAEATRLRSLSEKDRNKTSGRSLSKINGGLGLVERSRFRAQEMHELGPLACQQLPDRRLVEPLFADDNKAPAARLSEAPRPVKTFLKTVADTLDEQPHRLAAHFDKAFDPQDIVALRNIRQIGKAKHRYR